MRPIRHQADLLDMSRQASAFAVLAGWFKLGIFQILADGKARTLAELPGDTRALRITAPILSHLGLLVGAGDHYALSPAGQEIARTGLFMLAGALDGFDDLSRIGDVLSQGGPMRDRAGVSKATDGGVREEDIPRARAFMQMLYDNSESSARQTAAFTSRLLPQGASVVDVGGGHGRYGRELVECGHEVTIVDKAVCVDFAREIHGDKLAYRVADFMKDDIGGPYDAALLSNIIHGFSPDENRALIQRLSAALKPGGLIVFKDMFIDDLGAHPENAVVFGLTMLLYTQGGQSYTAAEVADICEKEGFSLVETVSLESYGLLFAKKKA